MHVIGWTTETSAPDGGFELIGRGPVRTVLAALPHGDDQTARLKAMVACFNAGLDFVPLSPSVTFTATQADQLARRYCASLTGQIARISGHGQMTLMLSEPARQLPAFQTSDGRDWLRSRGAQHLSAREKFQHAKQILDQIVSALPHLIHHSNPSGGGHRCDVLLPRAAASAFCNQVQASISPAVTDGPNLRLTFCGLWPAFHFSKVPEQVDANV